MTIISSNYNKGQSLLYSNCQTESNWREKKCSLLKSESFLILILSVVLYGCETRSVTLRKRRRLRVFENRVLRRVFGYKKDEVKLEWRRLHIEEIYGL